MDVTAVCPGGRADALTADDRDLALLGVIGGGLPLVERPYAAIGARLGMPEAEVILRIESLIARGVIKRFGLVVRHRAFGYLANAMIVWDVPPERISAIGARMAAASAVTLCYRRPRRPPAWPYNLFCMIHGRDRAAVQAEIGALIRDCELQDVPHAVLFSARCYRQRGARYGARSHLQVVR